MDLSKQQLHTYIKYRMICDFFFALAAAVTIVKICAMSAATQLTIGVTIPTAYDVRTSHINQCTINSPSAHLGTRK